MAREFSCPVCGRPATYLREAVEETVSPNVDPPDLNRLIALRRNFLVKCPEHGQKVLQEEGHHISTPGPHRRLKVKPQKK